MYSDIKDDYSLFKIILRRIILRLSMTKKKTSETDVYLFDTDELSRHLQNQNKILQKLLLKIKASDDSLLAKKKKDNS